MPGRIYAELVDINGTLFFGGLSADPNGILFAPKGSLANGPFGAFRNVDGASEWATFGPSAVPATPGGAGAFALPAGTTFAPCDTSTGAMILYLPAVADGAQCAVKIKVGTLPVQCTPIGANGVNGTTGATYLIDPLGAVPTRGAIFYGDASGVGTWELVSAT